MLEQISRISQQIGYYLHRASMRSGGTLLSRELHPIAPLLDSLTSALIRFISVKGSTSPSISRPKLASSANRTTYGVMGNVLDNACKYCLELLKSPSARRTITTCIFWSKTTGPGSRTASGAWCSIADSEPIRCVQARA
ncbi:Sensor protein PhoQ [Raoultella terrigena]|uniref:Sensor protein PhoQ n=1 Tax=Raoultella terrigena TaxID=577 RepID=A0A4U9CSG7_RAOTE|nr:Sensor protein PhoQ [Raoultella terrigena]